MLTYSLGFFGSTEMLVYVNLISLEFDSIETAFSSDGKSIQCGVKLQVNSKKQNLLMVAASNTTTSECTFHSVSLNDPTTFETYTINNTNGVKDCR